MRWLKRKKKISQCKFLLINVKTTSINSFFEFKSIDDISEKLDDFILRNFTIAALAGIALNGGSSSIVYGRQYLNHEDRAVKLEALKIVERFGDNSDVQTLVDLTKDSYGEVKTKSSTSSTK